MSDAENQSQGEPTMEEILASIRRIISEDSPEGEGEEAEEVEAQAEEAEAQAEAPAEEDPAPEMPEPEAPAEEDDDALELTQMVAEDGSVVDLNAEREAARAREEPPADEPPAEAPPVEEPEELELEETEPVGKEESILADATRATATSALLNLARTADEQSSLGRTEGGSRTLEMLVRETLEPHLKTWLDANLPVLVERIVREEIQKMVKRAEYR